MTESALAEHVRKAVSPVETAPKQKHVRSCIIYAWDHMSSKSVWHALKSQGVLADQIPCFKALITIHKLLVGGPHIVLGEALGELRFLEDCVRMQGSNNLGFGYAPLIRAYVDYLKAKIEFHRVHPEFTGSFDYEEYLSLKGVSDLNEGYQTIMELIDLQARLEQFARMILDGTHGVTTGNECRIAALVPLIEESHGLYKFLTSMLSAMHLSVESADPLVPLVERYNSLFWGLKKFYGDASRLPYLTSLIQIPVLPDEPPSFADIVVTRVIPAPTIKEEPAPPPAPTAPSVSSVSSADLLGDLIDAPEPTASQQLKGLQYGTHTNTIQTIAVPVVDESLHLLVQQLQAENGELRDQLHAAAAHISSLEELIRQDQNLRAELQRQLDLKELRHSEQLKALEDHLRSIRSEAETWKARSEAMGTMYQKLREEHLALLSGGPSKEAEEAARLEAERKRVEAEEAERLRREAEDAERRRIEEEERRRLKEEERKRIEEEEESLRAEQERRLRDEKEGLAENDPARELERLAKEVEEAANKFNLVALDLGSHIAFPSDVHSAILEETQAMTGALGLLIRRAIEAQKEILAEGRSLSPEEFYRKNSQWTNGLISAAQAVATATVLLVETANGSLLGESTLEQLVVASNNVAAATTQLVTASRVKAVKRSVAQPKLEEAAKAVTESNRRLVAVVSSSTSQEMKTAIPEGKAPNLPSYTVMEMNKQSEIQLVEKKLEVSRLELADMRRRKYQTDDSDDNTAGPIDVQEMNKQVEIKELEKRLAMVKLEYDMIQLKKPEGLTSKRDELLEEFDMINAPSANSTDNHLLF